MDAKALLMSILIACAAALALPGSSAAGDWSTAIADLPLPPGWTEIADEALVFDRPEGRIVGIALTGGDDPRPVLGYYAETLPQLGWTRSATDDPAGLAFVRGQERLTISTDTPVDGAALRLLVRLTPVAD